jgi:hypothetical protein
MLKENLCGLPIQIEIPQHVIDDFKPVRDKIQKAIDNNPKSFTLEQVKEQICRFQK